MRGTQATRTSWASTAVRRQREGRTALPMRARLKPASLCHASHKDPFWGLLLGPALGLLWALLWALHWALHWALLWVRNQPRAASLKRDRQMRSRQCCASGCMSLVRSRGSYRSSPRFRFSALAWRSPSPRPHEDCRVLPAPDFLATRAMPRCACGKMCDRLPGQAKRLLLLALLAGPCSARGRTS